MRQFNVLPLLLVIAIGCSSSSSNSNNWEDAADTSSTSEGGGDTDQQGQPLLFVDQAASRMASYAPHNASSVVMVDLNNDSTVDIVEATSDALNVWWNDGSGKFTRGLNSSIVVDSGGNTFADAGPEAGNDAGADPSQTGASSIKNTSMVVAIDVQGSGNADLVLLGDDNHPIRWLKNQGNQAFREVPLRWPLKDRPRDAVVADFDGDGMQDLLVTAAATGATQGSAPAVVLYINSGASGLVDQTQKRISAQGLRAWSAAAGDLDGDGHIDIFFSGDTMGHRLLLNDGNGYYRDAPADALPQLDNPAGRGVALGDITGDGALDILITSQKANHVYVSDKKGRFSDRTPFVFGANPGKGQIALIADLDGDNRQDAVIASAEDRLYILHNDGTGRLFDYTQNMVPYAPEISDIAGIRAADIDGDKDLDLLISRTNMARSWLLLNWAPNSMTDSDNDGVPDEIDNCPNDANPDQLNTDQYPFNCASGRECETLTKCKLLVFENSSYLSCKDGRTWDEAAAFCNKYGGHLVIVNSIKENKFITSLGYEQSWIGLNDKDTEGTFKWVDGTTPSELLKGLWAKGEPNNGGSGAKQNCVEIYVTAEEPGKWYDYKCDQALPFVCEDKLQRIPIDPGDKCDICPEVYNPKQSEPGDKDAGNTCVSSKSE